MKIESLTEEQKARFPEFVKKWNDIAACTEPADRKKAEAAINDAYRVAGKDPPEKIVWYDSPFAIIKGISTLSKGNCVGDSVKDSVKDSVWYSVGNSVTDSVWMSVWTVLGFGLRRFVRNSLWRSSWNTWNFGYGQHDAPWLAIFDFFRIAVGMNQETQKLIPLTKLAESAGWWIPYEKVCLVSERQNFLAWDNRGRLHSEIGPALTFPDGWAIYAVHGVKVPSWIIEKPDEISVEQIDEQSNAEIRRIMLNKFGWDRYIKEAEVKPQSKDKNGILYRRQIQDDEDLVMVGVLNSTPEPDGSLVVEEAVLKYGGEIMVSHDGLMMPLNSVPSGLRFKEYLLRVPPTVKTATEAVAWTFNIPTEDYKPVFQS